MLAVQGLLRQILHRYCQARDMGRNWSIKTKPAPTPRVKFQCDGNCRVRMLDHGGEPMLHIFIFSRIYHVDGESSCEWVGAWRLWQNLHILRSYYVARCLLTFITGKLCENPTRIFSSLPPPIPILPLDMVPARRDRPDLGDDKACERLRIH